MEVIKTMSPGAPGTIRYCKEWEDRLVNVRYRKDEANNRILTTVEIVVDARPLKKELGAGPLFPVRLRFWEESLRRKLLAGGASWDYKRRLWYVPRKLIRQYALEKRVILGADFLLKPKI